jgi:hypothetical protein
MNDLAKPVFAPCSEKQRLVLQDNETDILLIGGGRLVPPL